MNEITGTVNSVIDEVDMRILELQNFETQLEQIENKNTEQDTRLKQVEYKNKVQDVYVQGLFNENNDKRLTIEGEGNSLKLEGSKEGLVEVNKVVGDTLVNINKYLSDSSLTINNEYYKPHAVTDINRIKLNVDYTLVFDIVIKSNNTEFTLEGTTNYLVCQLGECKTQHGVTTHPTLNHPSTYRVKLSNHNRILFNVKNWSEEDSNYFGFRSLCKSNGESFTVDETIEYEFKNIMLLEGDYTNKPIPSEYFEGMQSSFEECKVTQEMVDSGEESVENLGNYKVEVKVRGKNLFDFDTYTMENVLNSNVTVDSIDKAITMQRTNTGKYEYVEFDVNLQANTPYVLSYNIDTLVNNSKPLRRFEFVYSDGTTKTILQGNTSFEKINEQKRIKKIRVCMEVIGSDKVILSKIQIEEGTQATPYEPYFERTQTVYLNSPLLKGDEIVCKEDGLYHYHKMGKVVLDGSDDEKWGMPNSQPDNTSRFYWLNIAPGGVNGANTICDKLPTKSGAMADMLGIWVDANIILNVPKTVTTIDECKLLLSSNPVTVVYELAEPYYEVISSDKLLLEIPNSATLSVESVIPCTSISATYTGGIPSLYGMEYDITTLQDTSVDIIATAWDTDFRVCEIEWTLEELTGAQQINLLSERGINTMALSRFEQAKIIILGDAYYRPTFEKQLATYLKRDYLTQEEYDILIAMMDARETIEGE